VGSGFGVRGVVINSDSAGGGSGVRGHAHPLHALTWRTWFSGNRESGARTSRRFHGRRARRELGEPLGGTEQVQQGLNPNLNPNLNLSPESRSRRRPERWRRQIPSRWWRGRGRGGGGGGGGAAGARCQSLPPPPISEEPRARPRPPPHSKPRPPALAPSPELAEWSGSRAPVLVPRSLSPVPSSSYPASLAEPLSWK
jgi:hypothetical protein